MCRSKSMFMGLFVCCALGMSVVSAETIETATYDYDVSTPSVPMFDPSLGALDKVTLSVTTEPTFAYVGVNNMNVEYGWEGPVYPGSGELSIGVRETLKVDINGQLGASAPKALSIWSGCRWVDAWEELVIFSAPGDLLSGEADTADLTGDLSAFFGTGLLDVAFNYQTSSYAYPISPIGMVSTPSTYVHDMEYTTGSPSGTLTYTYTTPEPAMLSLLALGGMAILRRRRK